MSKQDKQQEEGHAKHEHDVPHHTTINPGDVAPVGTPGTGENLCPDCSGTGKIEGKECYTCGGSGTVVEAVGGA